MILVEVISKIYELDEFQTIYLRAPWSPDSRAVVALEPDEGGLSPEVVEMGLSYFIEVAIAQDFLEDWKNSQSDPPICVNSARD